MHRCSALGGGQHCLRHGGSIQQQPSTMQVRACEHAAYQSLARITESMVQSSHLTYSIAITRERRRREAQHSVRQSTVTSECTQCSSHGRFDHSIHSQMVNMLWIHAERAP